MKKVKRLYYTLVAEGFAEYAFIPTYLRLMADTYGVQAVRSNLDIRKKQPSKSKVLNEAGKICTAAINEEHDLFIAGIDLDSADHDQSKHPKECDKLSSGMGDVYKLYKDQIIIYVPVQAIEHWLVYQAYKIKLADTYPANGVESKEQAELKKLLYQGKDDQFTMERIAKAIAEKADFDELAKQSKSFRHFHNQVKTFLGTFAM